MSQKTRLNSKMLSVIIMISSFVISCVHTQIVIPEKINRELLETFELWKAEFNKAYKTPGEESVRRMIFGMNLKKIEASNADPDKTFEMKANFFADMTQGEFGMILGTRNVSQRGLMTLPEDDFSDDGSNSIGSAGGDIDYENDPCIGPVEHQRELIHFYFFFSLVKRMDFKSEGEIIVQIFCM